MAIAVKRGFGGGGVKSKIPQITFNDSSLCQVETRDTDIIVHTKDISPTASAPKYLFAFTCEDNTPFKLYLDINANLRYRLRTIDLETEYINGYGATEVVLPKGSYRFDITSGTNNAWATGYRAIRFGSEYVCKANELYKNGVENTQVTGGLSDNDYTFGANYSRNGIVSYRDSIYMYVNSLNTTYFSGVITSDAIDMTPYKSVKVTYHREYDNLKSNVVVDVTNVNQNAYISVSAKQTNTSYINIGVSVSSAKTNVWDTNKLANNISSNMANGVYIDSIELIPND